MLQGVEPKKFLSIDGLSKFISLKNFRNKLQSTDSVKVCFSEQEISAIVEKIAKSKTTAQAVIAELNKLSDYCDLQHLESFFKADHPDILSIHEAIDAFAKNAHVFLSHANAENSESREIQVVGLVQSLLIALESFLDSLGLLTFFVPAVSHQETEEKNRQLTALMSFISMLSATFIPVLGPSLGGFFVAGICLSLITLSMTYQFWKQVPIRIPKFEKMNLENINVEQSLTCKRLGIVDKIANALIFSRSSKKQVLLLGDPGSGKTTIINALAERIHKNHYPELEGFELFYTDSASLLDNRDWVRPPKTGLEKISEMIQGVNQKMIFVFDQIHLLSFLYGKTFVGDQLTTMLDSPQAHFPYIIGAINTAEYHELKEKYPSFLERFSVVKIDPLEDEDVTLGLKINHLKHSGDCFVEEGVFEHLVAESKKKWKSAQVRSKMQQAVFLECQLRSSYQQKAPLQLQLMQVEELLQDYEAKRFIYSPAVFRKTSFVRDIGMVSAKHLKLKAEVEELLKEKQALFEQRKLCFCLKKHLYEMSTSPNIHENKKDQTMFFLMECFLLPALEQSIKSRAEKIGCNVSITKKLVDEVMKNMEA